MPEENMRSLMKEIAEETGFNYHGQTVGRNNRVYQEQVIDSLIKDGYFTFIGMRINKAKILAPAPKTTHKLKDEFGHEITITMAGGANWRSPKPGYSPRYDL